MQTQAHPFLGDLVTPSEPGSFKIAYTKNIVNKAVVNKVERIVNGHRKDVTYTMDFNQEWLNYESLAEVVTGHGWAIARPFEGEKSDATISMISYVGLDFDGITEAQFEEIKKQPFVNGRGFFHYSASHGTKPGVSGHWICPLEQMVSISTDEHRATWRLILMEIVDSIKLGDRKVKDLQRLFYGAQGQTHEVWGQGYITIEELEEIHNVALEKEKVQEAKRAAALVNSTKRRRSKDDFTFEKALELSEKYITPNLVNGNFPDIAFADGSIMDHYEAWIGYFLGWKDELSLEEAAKLMDAIAPDKGVGSFKKLRSFSNAHRNDSRRITFGTTMKLLRHFGYKPTTGVFGGAPLQVDSDLEKRYLDVADINFEEKAIMVKSAKGTGKTELIHNLIASGLRVLVIGHRRALLRNTTGRTGIPNYQDVIPSEATSLCITVDSLHKLDLKRQAFDIIIIDEVEQVLQHCIGDTLKDSRAATLSLFRILLKDADKVYCFDADLSYVSVNFMKKQLGVKNVYVVENTYQMSDRTIEIYLSKYDILRKTEEALDAGQKVALATNSKREADKAEEQLKKYAPSARIMCITQENSDDEAVQNFIQDISNRVSEVDVLIYSPSLGTGVSIKPEVPYFDYVHVIGVKDVTTHFDLDQQANRVRDIKSGVVRAFIGELYPEEDPREADANRLKQLCVANAHEIGVELVMNEDRSLSVAGHDAWYIELWADIMSLRNSSMNQLKQCFIKLMHEQGHQVVEMKMAKAERDAAKSRNFDALDEIVQRRVDAILEAELPTPLEYDELKQANSLSFDKKRQMEKYEINEFYQVPVTQELITADDEGRFRETIILIEMASGYQDAAYFDLTESSIRRGATEMESRVMVPHRKFYFQKKQLINEVFERAGLGSIDGRKLREFGARDAWYSNKSLASNGFVEWLGQEDTQERLERLLDIKLRANYADYASMIVGQVLRKLGFDITERRTSTKKNKTSKDQAAREYSVSQFSVDRLTDLIDARAERYHHMIITDPNAQPEVYEYEEAGKMVRVVVAPGVAVSYA